MKTFDTIMERFTGNWILDDLAEPMLEHESYFLPIERNYHKAIACLRKNIPEDISPTLDEYLDACRKDVIANMVYAAYLGYNINLENFRSPYSIQFERMDFTDYIRDHLIGNFPVNYESERIMEAFRKTLPTKYEPLTNPIRSYFISLDVSGTKLAHYAGYVIANKLLSWVVPGYREDTVQTLRYTSEMEKYMEYLPFE